MNTLALGILRHIPERARLRVLLEVRDQLEAEGEHAACAECSQLIRDLESMRPNQQPPPRASLPGKDTRTMRTGSTGIAITWDGEGEG